MADLIDRQAAIDAVNKICDRCGEHKKYDGVMCGTCYLDGVADIIEDLPSAQPEQRWTPCKVQNPKETGLYTVTLYIEELNDRMLDLAWYDEEKEGWARYEEKGWAKNRPVIAWMEPPILYNPIPYKEEQNVD